MNKLCLLAVVAAVVQLTPFSHNAFAATDNLSKRLASELKVSESDADKQVDAVIEAIKSELVAGNEVVIRNFGRFYIQARDAREGRNPKTGEKLQIPARKYPKFASADGLKKAVNP